MYTPGKEEFPRQEKMLHSQTPENAKRARVPRRDQQGRQLPYHAGLTCPC